MVKKILIHTCCAPCFTYIHDDMTRNREIFNMQVLEEDFTITSFWYNPNIQPKIEYEKRKNTLENYCLNENCNLVLVDEYNLKDFVKHTFEYNSRCEYCYYLRLNKTFEYAKSNGYDIVMTTLSISPYQNQELIKNIGKELEKKYNIKYMHLDYTVKFREGQKIAKDLNLYRQKYCGCIFSIDEGKWEY